MSNVISHTKSSGILICGGNIKDEAVKNSFDAIISFNTLRNCQSDGIAILNAFKFERIEVTDNEVFENSGNGIYLSSVISESEKDNALLTSNKIFNNETNGVFVVDTMCKFKKCEFEHNNGKGMLITTSNSKLEPRISIEGCLIKNNKCTGIGLIRTKGSKIRIESCKVVANENYGLEIADKDNNEQLKDDIMTNEQNINILLKEGEISDNQKGGIALSNGQQLLIDKSCIKNNSNLAISISSKGKVKYSERTLEDKRIIGIVKQHHKEINIYKSTGCQCVIL